VSAFTSVHRSKRPIEVPPPLDTPSNRGFRHSGQRRPFLEWSGIFPECKKPGIASVSSLLFRSGPSAVLRAITKIVVNSVQRKSNWTRPHVACECGESCATLPLVTDNNSSTSIPAEGFVTGVATPGVHRRPHFIYRCSTESVRGINTSLSTAARRLSAAPKGGCSSEACIAANTQAFPQFVFSQMSARSCYGEAAKDESSKIEGTRNILLFSSATAGGRTAAYEVSSDDACKSTALTRTIPYNLTIFRCTLSLQCCKFSEFVVREVSWYRHAFLRSCVVWCVCCENKRDVAHEFSVRSS
jgi:hypothetical protein